MSTLGLLCGRLYNRHKNAAETENPQNFRRALLGPHAEQQNGFKQPQKHNVYSPTQQDWMISAAY